MNTISKMCEGPSLEAKTKTTHVANPNHPSSPPSLGSTGALGSAPPEGGESKHPGVLMDLELGGVWAGEVQPPLGSVHPLAGVSLRPSLIGSWKLGCGFHLPPLPSPVAHPTPYHPAAPTKSSLSSPPSTPSPIHPKTSIHIKTATGGNKVVNKQLKNTSLPTPSYICDGIGCSFVTNSPYDYIQHQSTPHNWKPGSQNWCFNKAKVLAQGNKTVGLKASGPTTFPSTDIRVKKGELPPNIIQVSCCEEPTPLPSIPTTVTTTIPSKTPTPPAIAATTPTPISTSPMLSSTAPNPTSGSVTTIPTTTTPPKLYFPLSYFLWKRKLPPPTQNPVFLPWALFPKPRGNKVRSSSSLKWDRRLPGGTTYSFGVNDPNLGYSSHSVTLAEGVGVPKFKEDGSWARYSHILVPKTKHQNKPPNQSLNTSYYKLQSKRRVPRPKSGQNTNHKGHGLSHQDHLNGLVKQFPSEVPCKRKHHSLLSTKVIASSSTTTSSSSTVTSTTYPTTHGSLLHVPYPSKRTKWTRPLGGSLRGGGPSLPVIIKLIGSSPYSPQKDSPKLSIACQDSVIECPLSLIEHHSTLLKNLLLVNESCR